ncbi:MAG: cupredoxin domain-containing protein [Bacteroidia bacterium]|nr:cupredoxin domain-containing protein [Bacteroidia bacterium]
MKTKYFSYLILILIVIGMNGCSKSSSYIPVNNNPGSGVNPGGGGTTSPGANEVWMQNTAFNPSTKTITAGTTITWTNKDAASHDVSSLTGVFTSPAMGQGATFNFTFTTAGTYNYSCVFHQGMNGTIIVQ